MSPRLSRGRLTPGARGALAGAATLLCLAPGVARAATFFVDGCPAGADSHSGLSVDTPFATLTRALQAVIPGDFIAIRGAHPALGVHAAFDGVYWLAEVQTLPSGTAEQRLTIMGFAGEGPVLDGGAVTPYGFANLNAGFSHVALRDLTMRGFEEAAIMIGSDAGSDDAGSDALCEDVLIDHCELRENLGDGLLVRVPPAGAVRGLTVRSSLLASNNGAGLRVEGPVVELALVASELVNNAGAGASLAGGVRGLLVENSSFSTNGAWGLELLRLGALGPREYHLRWSTLTGNFFGGLLLDGAGPGTVRANRLLDNRGAGVELRGLDTGAEPLWLYNCLITGSNEPGIFVDGTSAQLRLAHNTLFHNDLLQRGVGELRLQGRVRGAWVLNNIAVATPGQVPLVIGQEATAQAAENRIAHNALWASGPGSVALIGTTSYDFTQLSDLLGAEHLGSDPRFNGAGAGDFTLKLGSPCVQAAEPLAEVRDDLQQLERPARPSIGAFEVDIQPVDHHRGGCGSCAAGAGAYWALGLLLGLRLRRRRPRARA